MAAPKHPLATEIKFPGLFSCVRSFSELGHRIEALSDEQQKGDGSWNNVLQAG